MSTMLEKSKLNFRLSVIACLSFANVSKGSITSLQDHRVSPECGDVAHEIVDDNQYDDTSSGATGESLRLFFSSFMVQSENPGRAQRHCTLNASVLVPAGYRFMPLSASAEGFYSINPKDTNSGGIKVNYVVQPGNMTAERTNKVPFTGDGDIHCLAELKDPAYTGCYNRATTINLTTELALWLDQKSPGNSVIQLDATRRNHNLYWNWRLKSCENYYDQKQFASSYVAYNGHRYNARLKFDLQEGTFESAAGFTGQFTNVRYSDDGLNVQGQWAALGAKGYFSFDMIHKSTGEFRGTWGDDNGYRAEWTGYYQ
jgi:hypothetical protein